MSILDTVESRTLLKALRDMGGQNTDALLIIEVLLARSVDATAVADQPPVMPR